MSLKTLATETTSGNAIGRSPREGDLLLGFSFSVWPDGSPGRCNEQIAKSLRADLIHVRGADKPTVGLQWEVFDALEDLNTGNIQALQFVPDRLVAGPPRFDPSDILNADAFLALLRDKRMPAVRRLHQCLRAQLDGQVSPGSAELCAALNRLIEDRRLFEVFDGLVDLSDSDRSLERPELSFLGREKRKLPTKGLYPRGLRKFQALRVNRLLIETIVSRTIVKSGQDLDVQRVADHVLDAVDVPAIQSVWIYAHPGHRNCCREKTIEALRERGWSGGDARVQFAGTVGWDPSRTWDADSAQVWCRSQENWDAFQDFRI